MRSFTHENRILRWLLVVVTLLTVIQVPELLGENLLNGARLGTFPKPDFRTNFTLKSNQGSGSYKEIRHGLNSDPFYVRVFARPTDGNNSGFCFNGIGSSQSSPSRSSFGGLIFAYNSDFVRIWAPSDLKGHVVFVKDGWGGEVNTQLSNEAEVVVEVWKDGPLPTFQIEHIIDTRTKEPNKAYLLIDHELRQLPERVVVRLSPLETSDAERNPNKGFWFHGIASSQNPDPSNNFGGVIFAYNERWVRLWAPDGLNQTTGCISIGEEWAGGFNSQRVKKCKVEILLWANQLPVPTFQSDWFGLRGQRDQHSFAEIYHGLKILPSLAIVQIKALNDMNIGYVFEAQGATQSDDDGFNEYGGVVFAYDENKVRIWAPSKHDESKKGYPILVKEGWGYGSNSQKGGFVNVEIRVVLYASKCNSSSQVIFEGDHCITTLYDSYKTLSSWSQCSSICNNGTQKRTLTGCQVTVKKPVFPSSCDFENGMCGWTSAIGGGAKLKWIRTNTSTPASNTGPLWGHPKGSFYIYTNTTNARVSDQAFLTSPNIGGAGNCYLRFFWNMYGSDVGTLAVHVNTKDPLLSIYPKWSESVWNMTGDQGDIFWRAAFVHLAEFSKIYQIRFIHTLPESNCGSEKALQCTICKNKQCPAANAAIDDIRLDCETKQDLLPVESCTNRWPVLSGCEMRADMPSSIGPAYSVEHDGKESYVRATGSQYDLIATYEFKVLSMASYVVWKQTFATTNATNDISFRVDEGDWYVWRLPYKGSSSLWTQFYTQQFKLRPGIHKLSLRQEEYGFRVSKLALVPIFLTMWTDLGMQSRHIPDSSLSAFPPNNNPEPRYGRLYARDAWCSSDHNRGYVYFQIRLPQLALLSGISVQGGKDILQKSNNYWVSSFRMKVSLDGVRYTWYRDTHGRRTFTANKDASRIVNHTLEFASPVRGVRIYPWDWAYWICLRTELYGIYLSSEVCANPSRAEGMSRSCVGDRDCGLNAECKLPHASKMQKKVSDNNVNQFNESCGCLHGYHGISCQHYGCSSNPCLNDGKCSEGNDTFHCTCQPSYHGDTCQHSCEEGYYGFNCSQKCLCQNGTCDGVTGHCSCERGYHGRYCELGCSPGYFGYNCVQRCQCRNGEVCHPVTGVCDCTVGWRGALCDKPCALNTWGKNCSLNCSCQESAKFCDRFTGECICLPGYFGKKCQYPCPVGTYDYNCSGSCQCQHDANCSSEDGTCNCTQAGWTGVLCDQPCPGGYYGVNCSQKCRCQKGSACDPITGSCICGSGSSGLLCDKTCSQGYWGKNCTIACSCVNGAFCNPINGQCKCENAGGCQCNPGWTGSDCTVPCGNGSWGGSCNNTCLCGPKGVCNQSNGNCHCLPGYTGSKCDHLCPQDRYGQNCTYKCNCSSSSSRGCDPLTGSCICKPGFVGPLCNIPCSAGQWGTNCSQSCYCVNGSCHPMSGNCTCNRGWKGLLCDQACPSCGQPCPTCHHSNGSCDQALGKCICFPGYQGSSCLEPCSAGYFGENCQRKCNCANGALCHHVTGECLCKPGWTGSRCEKRCPQGLFGMNCTQSCSCVRGTCNPHNGTCECLPGYHGDLCDNPCPSGWHGPGCGLRCLCGNGAACDHKTGQCRCSPGWTGLTCQQSCFNVSTVVGFFGANCSERCVCPGSCDPVKGTCFCPSGFRGPNCVESCLRGWYGPNCLQRCHCRNSASCDHVSGTCTCAPGWFGENCTERCPTGYYGMQCASKCRCSVNGTEVSTCDSVTGECNCRPGYRGYKCEEQCPEGFFGKNCSQRCICENSYACDFTDGTCYCKPGYHGQTCKLSCGTGYYGINCNNTCPCKKSNTKSCDKVDGSCTCLDGYTGVFCESVCSDGFYGSNCVQKCTCQNGAACDHVKGKCSCTAGFRGRNCDKVCDEGSFGVNCANSCSCRNGASCSPYTGECYCLPGFSGNRCESECPSGRYGIRCAHPCDCNLGNSPKCDPSTGKCICAPGFQGIRCDEPCDDDFYGEECKTQCPICSSHSFGPCEKVHGNCSCTPGYQGYLCFDDCALNRYGMHCKEVCECSVNELCHHINGMCLDLSRGKFSLIVQENVDELDLLARKRDIKRGLEKLMELYYDKTEDNGKWGTKVRRSLQDSDNATSHSTDESSDQTSNPESSDGLEDKEVKHVFMVRLLELQPVLTEKQENATRVVCVLLDNFTVVNGHFVDEVLSKVPSEDVSSTLLVEYYTGKLYRERPGSTIAVHLPLIIGVSVGFFLILIILALFALIRRRYKQKCGFSGYKKTTKDQSEFELQPWIGRSTGYLLAFDNPYYDVLAAMGLDDDVEEDYYNPLYDDVSVYSDSGENTSEDSCHKDLSSMVIR